MLYLIAYLFCAFSALGIGALAGWSDFRGMTIPNWISAAIGVLFMLAWISCHFAGVELFAPLWKHGLSGAMVLVISFVMFGLRMMGGGDSKLMAAYALWFTPKTVLGFLLYMAIAGGVLGALSLLLKNRKVFKAPREGSWIARVQAGESVVPYGIPIALGAALGFIVNGYVIPESFTLFLAP